MVIMRSQFLKSREFRKYGRCMFVCMFFTPLISVCFAMLLTCMSTWGMTQRYESLFILQHQISTSIFKDKEVMKQQTHVQSMSIILSLSVELIPVFKCTLKIAPFPNQNTMAQKYIVTATSDSAKMKLLYSCTITSFLSL